MKKLVTIPSFYNFLQIWMTKNQVKNPEFTYPWIIKENSIDIGNISFKGDPKDGIAEVGYSLLTSYRGKGYATEAVRKLIKFGFEKGINTIIAKTNINNNPYMWMLKKLE